MPVSGNTRDEAYEIYGMMSRAIAADNPSSSVKTRAELGWSPRHRGLIEDISVGECLEQGVMFRNMPIAVPRSQ